MRDCSPAPHTITPNPRRTRLPRTPALCNLTAEHSHQNLCKIFTALLHAHSSEAKNCHGLQPLSLNFFSVRISYYL